MLLDTHVWAWSLTGDPFVSAIARERMDEAQTLILSSVSFYEISHKVRLGKWPQMAPLVARLVGLAQQQSLFIAPVTAELALLAGLLDWSHRDPFDRMLAATALELDLDLISADMAFDEVPGLRRIW